MNSTYEEGNLFDAWEILVNKYEPKNSVTKNKLMSDFHNIKQDPKDTCVEYLHKIESIKDELELNFNYKIDESIYVNKVINDLLMKDVDDEKFKIKLKELNLDIVELEKELSKHDSYVESLNDLMSNLDNTSIDNHSSALSSTNFKNNNKKSKSKINSKVNSKNTNNSLEYNKSINNINTPHLKHYNKTKSNKDSVCNKCGKKGHQTEFCWSDLKCLYCGEKGHPERWCLNKMCDYCGKRKHLRPQCPYLNNKVNSNNFDSNFNNKNNKNYPHINENQSNGNIYDSNKHESNNSKMKRDSYNHRVNFTDKYYHVSKSHETNNLYEDNNILVLDEYNPDYVFNKVDNDYINEYIKDSSNNFLKQLNYNNDSLKINEGNEDSSFIEELHYPKESEINHFSDYNEIINCDFYYKINHPERPISSITIMDSDDLSNSKNKIKSTNNCSQCINNKNNSWISDTGASIHVTNDATGIVNKHTFRKDHLKYSNKNTDIIEFYGDLLCKVFDSNYNSINIIIRNVSYVPTCDNKPFSGTQVLNNDFMKEIIKINNILYTNYYYIFNLI